MSEYPVASNDFCAIDLVGRPGVLWRYSLRPSGRALAITPPVFEVDGAPRRAALCDLRPAGAPVTLPFGVTEYTFTGRLEEDESLQLDLILRLADDSPVVRFRYRLAGSRGRRLTRSAGRDRLDYLALDLAGLPQVREVRFSEFRETVHSFCLAENPLTPGDFDNGLAVMGPMLVAADGATSVLVAYEHGSQAPEAIVDFDVTEGSRYVGLGFLSAGKYFLINNGPYLHNYDIPFDRRTTWSNIFVHPGPARAWICRTPLTFDKWIPSVLFLTHYLPDDPESSQLINIASLILGQNGIWGDLLGVSDRGVGLFAKWLGLYKQVRRDITRSDPIRIGVPGGSPEIYEKIDPATGRGAVVAFASGAGRFDYVTRHAVHHQAVCTPGVALRRDVHGRAVLQFAYDGAGVRFALFGAEDRQVEAKSD